MTRALNIIIPVRNGSKLLSRSLESLLNQRPVAASVAIAIVVNDSEANERSASLDIANAHVNRIKAIGFHCVVLVSQPGRRQAFAAGEAVLPPGAMLYLDQDAALSKGALDLLSRVLCNEDCARFASLTLRFSRSKSQWVRCFYRGISALPYFTESPVTAGAYAVSQAGRARWRWEQMPLDVGDDKYVRLLFAPSERQHLHQESYEVQAQNSFRDLLQARTRYARMNCALSNCASELENSAGTRWRGVIPFLAWPGNWTKALVIAFTLGLARWSGRST
jgi:hypothetical protein